MEKSLKITEIFYSLQGESNTVGLPTVFIRLTGCPLRCSYCDTAYAFSGGKKQTLTAIVDQVDQFKARYITVTGGEPLAQTASHELMTMLLDKGYVVSLETSGTIDISAVDPRVLIVMDLKTPGSGELDKNDYKNIGNLADKDQIKFVIADTVDYEWSKSIINKYDLSSRCEILFSPVMEQMNPTELAESIIQDNLPVRFQIQLHKYLWDDAQGK
jgi:7-carboxy-7-deazaguanine synthase